MKAKKLLVGIVALTLSACASVEVSKPTRTLVSVNPSTYVVHDRGQTSVMRAFEDGTRTVIQFADFDGSVPFLYDENGDLIEYQHAGAYAMLPAVYSKVVIRQRKRISMVSHPSNPNVAIYYPTLRDGSMATIKTPIEAMPATKPRRIAVRRLPDATAGIISPFVATPPLPISELDPSAVIVRPLKRKP
jgi:hypothetical protein